MLIINLTHSGELFFDALTDTFGLCDKRSRRLDVISVRLIPPRRVTDETDVF